jgi:hypothetical protein
VAELITAIEDYLSAHKANPKPFVWTKTAKVILEKHARDRAKLQAAKTGNQALDSEHLVPPVLLARRHLVALGRVLCGSIDCWNRVGW